MFLLSLMALGFQKMPFGELTFRLLADILPERAAAGPKLPALYLSEHNHLSIPGNRFRLNREDVCSTKPAKFLAI